METIERLQELERERKETVRRINEYESWIANPAECEARGESIAWVKKQVKGFRRHLKKIEKEIIHLRQPPMFSFDSIEVRQLDLI